MRRIAWLSDTHLNMLPRPWRNRLFVERLKKYEFDDIILTGDISTGKSIISDLVWLTETFREQQIYFVMGNHDYHGYSFQTVNNKVSDLVLQLPNLHWLTYSGVVSLSSTTSLIGHEGWYDASLGDPSLLRWTIDWLCINELRSLPTMHNRIKMFIDLATRATFKLEQSLIIALESHDVVYIATHFPPWSIATTILGTRLENFWLPYSTNAIMGKMIESVAKEYPNKKLIVLSGHTHIHKVTQISDNLTCIISPATRFGQLSEHSIIEV